jgi:hypothetical protein
MAVFAFKLHQRKPALLLAFGVDQVVEPFRLQEVQFAVE